MNRDALLLLGLAAAATLLINLVLLDLAVGCVFPHPAAAAALGVGFAQVSLAAFWLVLGDGRLTLRALPALAVAGFWAGPLAGVTEQPAAGWLSVLLAQAAGVAAIGGAARARGVRLAPPRLLRRPPKAGGTSRRLQFRLWDALSWTTALCCVLAVARLASFPSAAAMRLAVFSLALAAAGCAAISGVLIARPPAAFLSAVAAPLAIGLLLAAVQIPPQPVGSLAAVTGLEGAVAACGAAVLRVSGYRLVRSPRVGASDRRPGPRP